MQDSKKKSGFSWGYLIIGILFILVSLVSFFNPTGNLETLAIVFGILAILGGIWLIINRRGSVWRIVAGILDILIGIFFLINIWATMAALPYIFAIWFIVDSIFRLINIGDAKALGNGYFWFSLILNILGIILGIMLLFNPVVAVLTLSFLVGFYLMLAGIECIVMAFSN